MPLRPIAPHYAPKASPPLKPIAPALPILTRYATKNHAPRLALRLAILALITSNLLYYAFSNL